MKPIKKQVVKKKKKIKKPKPKLKPVKKPVTEEIVKEEVVEEEVVEPTPPPISAATVADAENRYLSELNSIIARLAKNSYPRRAKRRHWEGEITLRFIINKDGSITNLQIIEKTSRDVLNKAALSIIEEKMAMKFKPFYKEINRNTWQLTLPISFTIKN